jgi:insertion element IS1 protein InsB
MVTCTTANSIITATTVDASSASASSHTLSRMQNARSSFYTAQYGEYEGVRAAAQHRAISQLARTTNHIERCNNTLRQRVSRLLREAWSFSKKLTNHIGAITLFICHYNLTRAAA